MNRRNFLGGVVGGSILATAVTPEAAHDPVEPMPRDFTSFEKLFGYGCDVSSVVVMHALVELGWESGAQPQPLLVVSPSIYIYAIDANKHLGDLCRVVAKRGVERDTWFVAWRGRRIGSDGA